MTRDRLTYLPKVGTRIMLIHGRKGEIDFGEIGTVTARNIGYTLQVALDDEQPYHREMWGKKSARTGWGHVVRDRITRGEAQTLEKVYQGNARRLAAAAKEWRRRAYLVEHPESDLDEDARVILEFEQGLG